jgi:hypothetical protein
MTRTYTNAPSQVWAAGQEDYDFAKAFSPDGTANETGGSGVWYSHMFQVDNEFLRIVAFNLVDPTTIKIEQVSGNYITNYCPINGPVTLSQHRTSYIIDRPGKYRLRLDGDITGVRVSGFRFAMENEAYGDLAEAFRYFASKAGIKLVLCS